jgi:putative tryptophan/tyrosine transport system substrate-binding protein
MRRRQFITLFGSAAVAWPLAALAQQRERIRRIGVLMNRVADDPESQVLIAAFMQALQQSGWTVGRNLHIDIRWGAGNAELTGKYAAELVALAPDVVLAPTTATVRAVHQVSRTVPVVFTTATDPVSGGLVASLAHPGGNVTGFTQREFGLSAKSLELLKEIAPRLSRMAVLRDSTTTGGAGQMGAIQAAAPALALEITPIDVREADEINRNVAAFARQSNGGLFVTTSAPAMVHRELIIALATRHRLPAIYPFRYYVASGGLISYGPDTLEPYRGAAGYVDRILKGEKPADLPVQAPTKYELVINLKTAKALGLSVPPSLLAIADEVIE